MRQLLCLFLLFCMLSLSGCGLLVITPPEPGPGPDEKEENTLPRLTTAIFSIGEADAIVIHNEKNAILIDTGEVEDAAEVLAYLRQRGITKLDALFFTHYDKDHVGGGAEIVRSMTIDAVYGTYQSKESEEQRLYAQALAERGLVPTVVREEKTLTFGDIRLTVYPPMQETYDKKESNNSSLVIRMEYGETSYLFCGDAQEDRIEELLPLGNALACDFMKVPYHGDPVDNLPALLSLTKPQYAVMTCSDKNPEDGDKKAALQAAGARVFVTRMGNVYAESDGVSLTVRHG